MLIITNQPEGYVIEWEVGIFHRLRDHGGVAVAVLHSQRRAACFRIYRQMPNLEVLAEHAIRMLVAGNGIGQPISTGCAERVNNNETAGRRD